MQKFSLLFEPFDLTPVHLKNRITMAPLFTGYANADGSVSRLMLEHYRQIAAGGASMIVVANVCVDPSGILSKNSLRADHDRFIPGLTKLSHAIKDEGAVAVVQLNHGGRFARTKKTYAPSAVAISDINLTGFYKIALRSQEMEQKWSILSDALDKQIPKEMTENDIERVIDAYASAALRAKKAGFDMVEIHGATGYLPVQFLSPRTNLRKDQYGGILNNRMRFPLKLVASVKSAVGQNFPVGYRFMADEWIPGGFGISEAKVFAEHLTGLKIAYLSVTGGSYEAFLTPDIIEKSGQLCYMVNLAREIKQSVATPIIISGRIITPDCAENILRNKDADLIGLARPLLADPDWPQKARLGNIESINLCNNCGTCFKMVVADRPVLCPQFERSKMIRRKQMLKEMRNPNKKVLIAMDGSENAAMGAAYAADMLSGHEHVQITILHIKTEESERYADEIREMMEIIQNLFKEKAIPESAITVLVKNQKTGIAGDILDEISTGAYGTVVVGRRGISRTKQFLFGSVSNKIIQNAKNCTVWIVD
jgi:2,4-dienoyl-CoA reductase-like NADH-dependent reductase (Old Yellow Enzyme family)/nucleotide-binding universal stress UspA family protein